MKYLKEGEIQKGLCIVVRIAAIMALLLAFAMPVNAAPEYKYNEKVPIYGYTYSPCTNEYVKVEGEIHVVYTYGTNPDGSYKYSGHTNYQGITGSGVDLLTGKPTGTEYIITGAENTKWQGEWSSGYEYSSQSNFHLISKGRSGNFNVHYKLSYTVNPDGTLDIKVDNFRSECSK